mgnify:CR=1 FL=1
MTPPEEIHHSRFLTSPPEEVFRAFTEAALLADWWGQHDFTNPECEMDARPGGRLRIVMRSPEGMDFPLLATVLEMDAPFHLSLAFDLTEFPDTWREAVCAVLPNTDAALVDEHQLDLTFSEQPTGTQLNLRFRFPTSAIRDAFQRCGMIEGWNEGLDSLTALLTRPALQLLHT